MPRRPFRFKQFAMTDQHCSMRIGTDGTVLGAWASAGERMRRVADIGAGCGLIALMIAQRARRATIDAVECDAGASADMRANFEASPWHDRLIAHECQFADFETDCRYDLIVSNPPYFTESLQSPDSGRALARHAGELCFESLARECRRLLDADGRLAVVLPSDQDDATLMQAALARLYPRRRCAVLPRPGARPVRTLWEFTMSDGECETTTLPLRDENDNFSPQYVALTKDFHIHL